jgi:hypothetical protein
MSSASEQSNNVGATFFIPVQFFVPVFLPAEGGMPAPANNHQQRGPMPQFEIPLPPIFFMMQHMAAQFAAYQQQQQQASPVKLRVQSQLKTLPLTKHRYEQSPSCPICTEEWQVGTMVDVLPCGHCYHKDCISQWISSNNHCPMCRFELEVENDETVNEGVRSRMAGRESKYWDGDAEFHIEIKEAARHTHCSLEIMGLCSINHSEAETEGSHSYSTSTPHLLTLSGCQHTFHTECMRAQLAIHGYSENEKSIRCPSCRKLGNISEPDYQIPLSTEALSIEKH